MTLDLKAEQFRPLRQDGCSTLPYAWNTGCARFWASLGFPAIATTCPHCGVELIGYAAPHEGCATTACGIHSIADLAGCLAGGLYLPPLLFAEPSPAPIKHWLSQIGLIDSPRCAAHAAGQRAACRPHRARGGTAPWRAVSLPHCSI